MTHIQNTAPGPPTNIAEATPARLPVPTRLDSDTENALNEPIFFVRSASSAEAVAELSSTLLIYIGRPVIIFTMSPSSRNCTPFDLTVKYTAQPTSITTTT